MSPFAATKSLRSRKGTNSLAKWMARPERFELPTFWFVAIQVELIGVSVPGLAQANHTSVILGADFPAKVGLRAKHYRC